ncbi:MAG: HAD family phosphatase [Clostridia bacterium]|nr:HAD family phosphatase [Clostridia bacterium]
MKIKNVVFDFGQVLVHFDPEYMVGQYVKDEADAKLLEEVVFDRLYWDKLDAGTISDEETLEKCRKRLPERLWEVADTIYYNWVYNIPEIDGMRELTLYLKEKYGVKLLVLSNISKYFDNHSGEIPILLPFDGCVFSSRIGVTKPSREIFEYLCKKFDLIPSETLFIDDNSANIKGAIDFGINGYIFDGDSEKLKKYLDEILK